VTAVAITHPVELVALEIETSGGVEKLRCTPGHPLFETGRGQFVAAEDLSPGDGLALADDRTATIRDIGHEDALPGETFTTYNFAVDDSHRYFVGRAGVWAHNAGGVCSELASVYRKALRKSGKSEEATAAVVDRLAKMLAKPGADVKAIEAEIKKARIEGITGEELLKQSREKAGPRSTKRRPAWKSSNTGDTSSNSRLLRKNMAGQLKDGEDAHHIVQSTHPRASASRDLLDKYQIDVNSAENGVGLLPTGDKPAHHGHQLHSHDAIDAVSCARP
jgi:hypothetical protein